MISEQQLKANQENAKLGGVKTEEGKEISKYNSVKHGVFSQAFTEYEKSEVSKLIESLNNEFSPSSFEENLLVSRLANYLIKQSRIHKAETELMLGALNPRVVETADWLKPPMPDTVVVNDGYVSILGNGHIETLSNIYFRYQIGIENRIDKTIDRLKEIQRQKSDNSDNSDKSDQNTNTIKFFGVKKS